MLLHGGNTFRLPFWGRSLIVLIVISMMYVSNSARRGLRGGGTLNLRLQNTTCSRRSLGFGVGRRDIRSGFGEGGANEPRECSKRERNAKRARKTGQGYMQIETATNCCSDYIPKEIIRGDSFSFLMPTIIRASQTLPLCKIDLSVSLTLQGVPYLETLSF
jgi:hypothetical protein